MRRQRRRLRQQQLQQQSHSGNGDGNTTTTTATNSGGKIESHPLYSYRCIVLTTATFLTLVGASVMFSSWTSSSTASALGSTTTQQQFLYSDPKEIPVEVLWNLDAILVLGGGRPESLYTPPIYVQQRADDAVSVLQRIQSTTTTTTTTMTTKKIERLGRGQHNNNNNNTDIASLPILCLSAGTEHLPQLLGTEDGLPVWESTSCAAYLAQQHNIHNNVYVETTSYDTIGNAFYARTTHTDRSGWRNLLIITNEFHMERTMTIFDWIFLECDEKNDDNNNSNNHDDGSTNNKRKKKKQAKKVSSYRLYYLSSPNVGLTDEAVQARKEREASSTKTLREILIPKYSGSLTNVWYFLTHEHSLYTANKLVDRASGHGDAKASAMVQKSYGAAGSGG